MIPALLFSCSSEKKTEKIVAEAYEFKLTKNDLEAFTPESERGQAKKDFQKQFVQQWVKDKTIEHFAKKEGVKKGSFKLQRHQLEMALIKNAYESKVIKSELDTNVSAKEIESFYEDNKELFAIDDYLIKYMFLKAKSASPEVYKLYSWYAQTDSVSMDLLSSWALSNAEDFILDTTSYKFFKDVEPMLPEPMMYSKQNLILRNGQRVYQDDEYIYFFKIYESQTGFSPLEFESDNIKGKILQQRIQEIKDEHFNHLHKNAISNKKVKIYE